MKRHSIQLIFRTMSIAAMVTLNMTTNPLCQAEAPVGTAISYSRNNMKLDNVTLNGTYDVRYILWDSETDGSQIGPAITKTGVLITNGQLPARGVDFGEGAFDDGARWIEVQVRRGSNEFRRVGQRVRFLAVPYALSIPGLYTDQTAAGHNVLCDGDLIVKGRFGTANEMPLELTVNGNRVFRGETVNGWANVIGGTSGNSVAAGVAAATIAGGGRPDYPNNVSAGAGTIGGGWDNRVSGPWGTVCGGASNAASGLYALIAGGKDNIASGGFSSVGGGDVNTASGVASTVSGGGNNAASGYLSVVGGGSFNTASGQASTVPGGYKNEATGNYSFAAGFRAKANAPGAFVWADSTNADFVVPDPNSFVARATGGVAFHTNPTSTTGVVLFGGSGTWSSISDRNTKENLVAVDSREILDRVIALPLSTWNYKSQDDSVRHIGPMAQDFHAAFNVGEDNRHITTIDADGVLFAAIQGLNALLKERELENQALKADLVQLRVELNAMWAEIRN